MISVQNVHKNYGAIEAVRNVSLEVPGGRILGLLGPNGAGKTTLMRILTCFMPPTSGQAQVAGFDIWEQAEEVRRVIGYMPENPPVYPEMIVSSFLRFVAQIKEVPHSQIEKSVEKAMEKVHIGHIRGRVIGHLSRGYRQRVGLAQALVHNPKVIVLDEPTLGLDPSQIIEIRELIRSLAGEHTVILSSHILPEVQATCQEVAIIHQGKIVTKDSVSALTQGQRFLVSFKMAQEGLTFQESLSRLPEIREVGKRPSEAGTLSYEIFYDGPSQKVAEAIFETCVSNHWTLLEMSPVRTSLEEIFLRITAKDVEDSI